MPYTPKTPLYHGIAPQNLGYVSDHDEFLNGNTEPYGHTFDAYDAAQNPGDFVEAFAGVDVVNNREVSPNSRHKGGATRSIGFLSKEALVPGMFKIYVSVGRDSNGIATSDDGFQGGPTEPFGYALP
ncbi:hypothetical protein [Paraburkholderia caribensis]|uniref:hypothetical protein n=1 Tax=Paraburkholderia caribensis TaxID=75105 RepID=UPI00071FD283|nr:hypothetical protein [Paraburkholderia caribensis]ALP62845.1 hypothetical protein AN416_09705 [Paraburkholderia caribensis]AUT51924.1 hypothetical protein C2L66_08695 [Paraburkholderia caribensis]